MSERSSIQRYDGSDRGLLGRLAERLPAHHPLRWPTFVDAYYASSPRCSLTLVAGADGHPQAALGIERMRFLVDGDPVDVAIGSNFVALEAGTGGLLFIDWLRTCRHALVVNCSPDTERIAREQRWTFHKGARRYRFNRSLTTQPHAPWYRNLAKRLANAVARRQPVPTGDGSVRADEVPCVTAEHIPRESAYRVRFRPELDDLRWRFGPDSRLGRYRHFALTAGEQGVGYAIIQQRPDALVVAHTDGADPIQLAQGVLAAVAAVAGELRRPPQVSVAAAHPAEQAVYEAAGFVSEREMLVATGGLRGGLGGSAGGEDASGWLVDLDWGDTALLPWSAAS